MRISIITPSKSMQLELKSQPVKLQSPFGSYRNSAGFWRTMRFDCRQKVFNYLPGFNQFHLDFSSKNLETIKVKGKKL